MFKPNIFFYVLKKGLLFGSQRLFFCGYLVLYKLLIQKNYKIKTGLQSSGN